MKIGVGVEKANACLDLQKNFRIKVLAVLFQETQHASIVLPVVVFVALIRLRTIPTAEKKRCGHRTSIHHYKHESEQSVSIS